MKKNIFLSITAIVCSLMLMTSCGSTRNASTDYSQSNRSDGKPKELKLSKQVIAEKFMTTGQDGQSNMNLDKLKQIEFRIANSGVDVPYAGGEVKNGDNVTYYDEIAIGEEARFIGVQEGSFAFQIRDYTILARYNDATGVVYGVKIVGYAASVGNVHFVFDDIRMKKPSTQSSGGNTSSSL